MLDSNIHCESCPFTQMDLYVTDLTGETAEMNQTLVYGLIARSISGGEDLSRPADTEPQKWLAAKGCAKAILQNECPLFQAENMGGGVLLKIKEEK